MTTPHFQNTLPSCLSAVAETHSSFTSPSSFSFMAQVIYTLPCLLGPPCKHSAGCQRHAKAQLNDQPWQPKSTLAGKENSAFPLLSPTPSFHSELQGKLD